MTELEAQRAEAESISCPRCQTPLGNQQKLRNSQRRCQKCGARVVIDRQGSMTLQNTPGEPGRTVGAVPPPVPGPDNLILEMLTWTEDILVRMIRGVVHFSLVHVPRELFRAFVRWFPTLTKLVKVLCLAFVWLVLTLSPLTWLLADGHLQRIVPEGWKLRPESFDAHVQLWTGLIYGYTAIALVGSVWGIFYLKRRIRRLRASR